MESLRRIITLCLLGAGALPLLAGCGGGGGSNGNSGTGTTGTTGTGTGGGGGPTSVSVVEPNGLTASLSENTNTIAVGGSVSYTLTLNNTTAGAVSIHYSAANPGVPPAGLVVRDAAGNVVFTPVPGPPSFDTLSLAPGNILASTQTVTGYTTHGTYTATASFNDGGAVTTLPALTVAVQ